MEIAKTWATQNWIPENQEIARDPWILGCRQYLQQCGSAGDALVAPELRKYGVALSWYGGNDIQDEKFRIEPLLLTNVSYDIIAKDMGDDLDSETVQIYEKLFFNIRNDKGEVSTSSYRRGYFAQPDGPAIDENTSESTIWRVMGNQGGYRMLVNYWGWTYAHGPDITEDYIMRELARMMQVAMQRRILRGAVNNFDLMSLLGQHIQYTRMRHETGQESSAATGTTKSLLGVLGLMRPKLLAAAQTADQKRKVMDALTVKMQADKNIASQVVGDMGPEQGVEYLTKLQDEQLRSAK
jgi:hypothetical protein